MSTAIPTIPFRVVTDMKVGGVLRRENRNATTLVQAVEIMNKELHKPTTRRAEILMVLHSAERRGGVEPWS
jgi:hypothetical protein